MSDMTVDITQLAGRADSRWLQPEALETLQAMVGQLAPWQDVSYAHIEAGDSHESATLVAITERVVVTIHLRNAGGQPHAGAARVQPLARLESAFLDASPAAPSPSTEPARVHYRLHWSKAGGIFPLAQPGVPHATVIASIGDPLEVLDALSRIWAKQ